MANVIKIKRGTGSNPSSLAQGELAIREDTNELFYGKGATPTVTKLVGPDLIGVASFQTNLSGLTPNSATTGVVTLSGTLGVANGGTGTNTSPTAGGIIYGLNSNAYASTSAGTAGQFLISNGTGTPKWSSTISEDSGGGVILTGGTRGNFNLGSVGKSVGTPSNGDFWWNSSDNTLRFFPNSLSGGKVLAYTSDIPTVNNATLTLGVSGTGLSGSATFTANDANNVTFTVTSNANSSNGNGTIVARDANGSFSANVVTASLSGNASTASAWQTARTITLGGDLTGSVSINGSSNVTLTATVAANSVALGTDTTGNYVAGISGTTNEIEVSGSGSEGATVTIGLPDSVTITSNLTVGGDLTVNGNTVTVNTSTLSVEDPLIKLALGNNADSLDIGFYGVYESAEVETYTGFFRDQTDNKYKLFTGLQAEPTTTVNTSGTGYTVGTLVANLEGNASTASAWQTARTITLGGDLTGSVSINGSSNVTLTATVAANSVALGTDTTGNYVAAISAGTGISVSGSGSENATVTINNSDPGSSQNIFKNIAVSGQTLVVADSNDDTLTFAAGTGITLTTNANTDTVTITNANPDQTVSLTGSGSVSISGTYPNFTISGTDTNTTYSAGTGLSLSGTTFALGTGNVLSLHNLSTSGYVVRTGANTVAARSITSTDSTVSITNGDGISGNTVLSIANTTIDGGTY